MSTYRYKNSSVRYTPPYNLLLQNYSEGGCGRVAKGIEPVCVEVPSPPKSIEGGIECSYRNFPLNNTWKTYSHTNNYRRMTLAYNMY